MHLTTRNVNTAFHELVGIVSHDGYSISRDEQVAPIVKKPSRNGLVLMIDEPITVTYTHPRERVLFNAARDANPFFHLYEALWMLTGRNDVAPLSTYNSRMASFSDDGETLNGAYGYRWRKAKVGRKEPEAYYRWDVDQLDVLVAHLKADPNSRRAVLQMWNVEDDLLKIGVQDTTTEANQKWRTFAPPSKDVCCNLSVMFSVRPCTSCDGLGTYRGRYTPDDPDSPYVEEPCENHETFLDMTVTNRSNDLVWGMLGANYVHFSFLQEYMAARLGAAVGYYHHFTNNLHAYVERPDWKPDDWLNAEEQRYTDNYPNSNWNLASLVHDPAAFERELPTFVEHFASDTLDKRDPFQTWTEPFLNDVARPMLIAFQSHKRKAATTDEWVRRIASADWRLAAGDWIKRRLERAVSK